MSRNTTTTTSLALCLLFLVLNVTKISSTDNKYGRPEPIIIPTSLAPTSAVDDQHNNKNNDSFSVSSSSSSGKRSNDEDTTYSTDTKLVISSSNSLTNLYRRKNFYNKKKQQNKYLKILARQMIWDNAIEADRKWNETLAELHRMRESYKERVNRSHEGGRGVRQKRAPENNEGESLCLKLCDCTQDHIKNVKVYCEFKTQEVSLILIIFYFLVEYI